MSWPCDGCRVVPEKASVRGGTAHSPVSSVSPPLRYHSLLQHTEPWLASFFAGWMCCGPFPSKNKYAPGHFVFKMPLGFSIKLKWQRTPLNGNGSINSRTWWTPRGKLGQIKIQQKVILVLGEPFLLPLNNPSCQREAQCSLNAQLSCLWKLKVSQSCLTLCDPMDCSPPGSSVLGILQAGILEWVAIPFSRGSSWPLVSGEK